MVTEMVLIERADLSCLKYSEDEEKCMECYQ